MGITEGALTMKEVKAFTTIMFASLIAMAGLIILLLTASCTYSIILNQTDGTADDMVDQTQTSNPTIEGKASVTP